ncbi:MAG TPA: NAD(P)-binding domain-containing protein [Kofleriaceae bacterium]|nr:NAD(P)-binding domain-containing protein [Kofleriaceae bacterium]
MATRIAVIGSGNVGGNLGARLSKSGFPVHFGVRDAKGNDELLARCAKDAAAVPVAEAAQWAEVVFLAVPAAAAVEVAKGLAAQLEGKIVVDCNNPLVWKEGPVWTPPAEGSLAAAIAKVVPGARVVKAFNTFGAEFHADPLHAGAPAAQVYMAGDDAAAKQALAEIAAEAGFRTVDSGPLRNAALVENLAILWIHLATVGGHGRNFVFAMQGKPAAGLPL